MDYSPLNQAFYNINEVRNEIPQENDDIQDQNEIDYENYMNMHDNDRFGQTGNTENLIPGYTGRVNGNSHGYLDTTPQKINGKEHFNGNEHFNGHNYWNGQVIRNGINSNISERFTSDNGNCNCKHNTFLLYLCILLLVILYFKK
jgi:hypothetical protein